MLVLNQIFCHDHEPKTSVHSLLEILCPSSRIYLLPINKYVEENNGHGFNFRA